MCVCVCVQVMTIVAKKNLEPGKDHLEKQCSQAFDQLNQVNVCIVVLALIF